MGFGSDIDTQFDMYTSTFFCSKPTRIHSRLPNQMPQPSSLDSIAPYPAVSHITQALQLYKSLERNRKNNVHILSSKRPSSTF